MSNMDEAGIRLVAEGAQTFQSTLQAAARATQDFTAQITKATSAAARAGSGLDKVTKSSTQLSAAQQALARGFEIFAGQAAGANYQIINFANSITRMLGPIGLVVAALTAAGAALIGLGERGGLVRGVSESFDNLTASIGLSADVLRTKLREGAAGTINDFELLKSANLALAGASGEFARQFGESLPTLLKAARVQSIATGQSVEYLYDSLVLGIKRASPRLIDNTGIVIKVGEAYQVMADRLGKTRTELTATEQQQAVLNATLAASQRAIAASGDIAETSAQKTARLGATIQNFIDQLAVQFEPTFNKILDGAQEVLGSILGWLGEAAQTIGDFVGVIWPAIEGIVNLLRPVADLLGGVLGIALDGLAKLIGFFANIFLAFWVKIIQPVVFLIAKGIADLFVGHSPPPMGPLSKMDEGGKRTMEAWLQGFVAAGIQPVMQVAASVTAALGSIATMSREQVEVRLAQLDAALQPFADHLAIVKSNFEALAEPAKKAIEAIDRQVNAAQAALLGGDQEAASLIRQLDAQREALQGYVDLQQEAVDNAEIQLAFAQAQQVQERTLLQIRQAALGPGMKEAAAAKAKAPAKAKKGKAAADVGEADLAGLAQPTDAMGQKIKGERAFEEEQRKKAEGQKRIYDIFGISPELAKEAEANSTLIDEQMARFKQPEIVKKFQAISDAFDPNKEGSIVWLVKEFMRQLFDPEVERSIGWWLFTWPLGLGDRLFTTLRDIINTPYRNAMQAMVNDTADKMDGPKNSLGWALDLGIQTFSLFPELISALLNPMQSKLEHGLSEPLAIVLDKFSMILENFFNNTWIPFLQKLATSASEIIGALPGGQETASRLKMFAQASVKVQFERLSQYFRTAEATAAQNIFESAYGPAGVGAMQLPDYMQPGHPNYNAWLQSQGIYVPRPGTHAPGVGNLPSPGATPVPVPAIPMGGASYNNTTNMGGVNINVNGGGSNIGAANQTAAKLNAYAPKRYVP